MKNAIFALLLKYILLFSLGGSCYYLIELLYRGRSHISMALCGGFCLWAIYLIFDRLKGVGVIAKAFLGALVITAAELFTGWIVNILLSLSVWDYSRVPLNLFGQICLPFSLIWFLMCFPIMYLCKILKAHVFSCPIFNKY